MKTLEEIKTILKELRKVSKTDDQFLEAVAVMYLSCAIDREFLATLETTKAEVKL